MADLTGKYKMVSSDNFDEYMKALGVGFALRKIANAQWPTTEVQQVSADEYILKSISTFKTTEIKFKLGEEFDETTADGRKVKTTVTREGNTLIQVQKGDVETTLRREFDGDDYNLTLTAKDVTSVRKYKKEK